MELHLERVDGAYLMVALGDFVTSVPRLTPSQDAHQRDGET